MKAEDSNKNIADGVLIIDIHVKERKAVLLPI